VSDAAETAARASDDERDAFEARARYQSEGLPHRAPDDLVAGHLENDESLIDIRQAVRMHRQPALDGDDLLPGRLYLTTLRLLLLGHRPLAVRLDSIEEVGLAGERLLVTLRDATGFTIEVSRPRLLRVQIAAALEAARGLG
jgi:hypothetical protein